jgi:hypothetical protein
VRPLLNGGKVRKQYGKLFAPAVYTAAARQPDRGALTDERMGKVSGDVNAPPAKVAMHALVGRDGSVQLIATNFTLKIRTKLGATPLLIKRAIELTFEKSPNGKWLVNAYRVTTTRTPGSSKAASTTKTTEKP